MGGFQVPPPPLRFVRGGVLNGCLMGMRGSPKVVYQIGFYPKKEQTFAGDRSDSMVITFKHIHVCHFLCSKLFFCHLWKSVSDKNEILFFWWPPHNLSGYGHVVAAR